MKVYFDLDGVRADFDAVFRKTTRQTITRPFRDEVADSWDPGPAYRLTDEEVLKVWYSPHFMENLERAPVMRIGDNLLKMFENADRCYLTNRGCFADTPELAEQTRDATRKWLVTTGAPELPLHFVLDKAEFVKSEGFDVAVEDAPRHIIELLDLGLTVMMPVWPYNEHLIGREGLIPIIR